MGHHYVHSPNKNPDSYKVGPSKDISTLGAHITQITNANNANNYSIHGVYTPTSQCVDDADWYMIYSWWILDTCQKIYFLAGEYTWPLIAKD